MEQKVVKMGFRSPIKWFDGEDINYADEKMCENIVQGSVNNGFVFMENNIALIVPQENITYIWLKTEQEEESRIITV